FDDDKVSFTVETPNGYIINIDEDAQEIGIADEHGNLVLMDAEGITVESSADLNLRATGDVNIEGTNMTSKASSKFSADGGSGAELTSGGQAVIKGSLVAIN
ncbi:MAG: Rhs element Vgr protein, partial [Cyclobacteriaceae bacterium]